MWLSARCHPDPDSYRDVSGSAGSKSTIPLIFYIYETYGTPKIYFQKNRKRRKVFIEIIGRMRC